MLNLTTNIELRKGRPYAYKKLFEVLYPRLKVYCSLFIPDNSQVEDIIQESFIALWENRKSIRVEGSIESLVFVMVRNRCLNVLRKKCVEEGGFDMDKMHLNELQYLYHLDFTGKENKSLEEELIESFKLAVDNLPSKMKLVFTRCKMEGRKQTEVAQELGISLKMVEKHISKAKKLIKVKLLEHYPALLVVIAFLLDI